MKDGEFHIGKIIKRIVSQKHISSMNLTEAIHRYQKNADKIYKLEDMDVEDVIQISYMLKYNICRFSNRRAIVEPFKRNTAWSDFAGRIYL